MPTEKDGKQVIEYTIDDAEDALLLLRHLVDSADRNSQDERPASGVVVTGRFLEQFREVYARVFGTPSGNTIH